MTTTVLEPRTPRASGQTIRLARPTGADPARPPVDEQQRSAIAHRGPVLRVLGAPGTGKTTTAIEIVAARVRAGELGADSCLLIGPTRQAAGRLRDAVTVAVGGTTSTPLARTMAALAFGILRQEAALRGEPAPRLLSGPEQDVVLGELLAGHRSGAGRDPGWPPELSAALPSRGFRTELRDLLMRAVEHGLTPSDLAALGVAQDRPEWVAAASVFAEYDEVTALATPGAYDPAWILGVTADELAADDEALARVAAQIRLLVVDDAQELTPAAARLLEVLAGAHIDIVLLGDPDAAVQTFRGADPRFLASGWTALGDGPTIVLDTAYRLPEVVAQAAARVVRHIGSVGEVGHRTPATRTPGGVVEAHVLRSGAHEASFVAGVLREAHLLGGMPWSDCAVIVRGGARAATLRRVLSSEGVPVAVDPVAVALRDEVAVQPFLALLQAALPIAAGQTEIIEPDVVVDVLLSPVGGADALTLRRLRRVLRRRELDEGGSRRSDELLVEAVLTPVVLTELGTEAIPARRVAAVLRAAVDALRAPGASAETVLWAMWRASGLSRPWQEAALAGGPAGRRRDHDLDAMVRLFEVAARFVDRMPGTSPAGFLDHVRSLDVAGDSLQVTGGGDVVEIVTPAAAAGRQWRVVVVAGVQEGAWPDLRLRGSVLGSSELVDVVTGRAGSWRAAQAAVRHDETRLFHVAVTRATERVVVTAVRSDDEQPSPYLDLIDPLDGDPVGLQVRAVTEVDRPTTLRRLVAMVRRDVLRADPAARAAAVRRLARLVAADAPGADPANWWARIDVTDDRPVREPDDPVTVAPSQVERFGQCGLLWFLTSHGGIKPGVGSRDVGVLVHEIAATHGDATPVEVLRAALDANWGRLGLPPGWATDRKHREAHAMMARLAAFWTATGAAGWRRAAVEEAMRVELGRAVLRGRVDRIDVGSDGSVRIADYKTGSSKPTVAELVEHPQLGAYQVAVEAGAFAAVGSRSGGAALVQLGKAATQKPEPQVQAALADSDDPQWAHRLIAQTAEGMAAARMTASVGSHCRTCPVATSCPAQPEGRQL